MERVDFDYCCALRSVLQTRHDHLLARRKDYFDHRHRRPAVEPEAGPVALGLRHWRWPLFDNFPLSGSAAAVHCWRWARTAMPGARLNHENEGAVVSVSLASNFESKAPLALKMIPTDQKGLPSRQTLPGGAQLDPHMYSHIVRIDLEAAAPEQSVS